MRSQRFITSAMLCSITSTPQSYFGPDVDDELAQLVCLGGGKPGGRLVEQEKLRIDRKRPRKPDAAFFAIAKPGSETMRLFGQLELGEDIERAPPRLRTPEPLRHVADLDVLAHAQSAEQAHRLKGPHHAGVRKAVARQPGAVAFADDDGAG